MLSMVVVVVVVLFGQRLRPPPRPGRYRARELRAVPGRRRRRAAQLRRPDRRDVHEVLYRALLLHHRGFKNRTYL